MEVTQREAAQKMRKAKAQIDLTDIEVEMEWEIDRGSLASSHRSCRARCNHARSSMVAPRLVRDTIYSRSSCPIANSMVRPDPGCQRRHVSAMSMSVIILFRLGYR